MPWTEFLNAPKEEFGKTIPLLRNLLKQLQPGLDISPETRRTLLTSLLNGLEDRSGGLTLDTPDDELATVFTVIKQLGRTPIGTDTLTSPEALGIFLKFSGLEQGAKLNVTLEDPTEDITELASNLVLDDDLNLLSISQEECMRCLCNTLTLHASARSNFPELLTNNLVWFDGLVKMISLSGAGFFAGRILFLLTAQPSKFVEELAVRSSLVASMVQFAQTYVEDLQASRAIRPASLKTTPVPSRTDTLREHLKLAYNLMLQYGRLEHMVTELKDDKVYDEPLSSGGLPVSKVTPFLPLFQPYLKLSCLLPIDPVNLAPTEQPTLKYCLYTLLNFPVEIEQLGYDYSWIQPVDGTDSSAYPTLSPLPGRVLQVIDGLTGYWFPSDVRGKRSDGQPSDKVPSGTDELVNLTIKDASKADEILGPLCLILRKISIVKEANDAIRQVLIPDDLDRTIPLDSRTDLTGQLVRLMGSILLPNASYAAGELLYTLANRDPTRFSLLIGYGNASGFLQNRGELIPPPPKWEESTQNPEKSRLVNSITGAYDVPSAPAGSDMTDDEKQRESERLAVLFDRMAKTGVLKVENPIEKAKKEGKLEVSAQEQEEDVKRQLEEEEKEEREALEELQRYRDRKRALGEA